MRPIVTDGVAWPDTMSPGPRSSLLRSGILIHPAIWPQQTWAENWRAVPLWGDELGPHLTQCGLDQGLSVCPRPYAHTTARTWMQLGGLVEAAP